MSAASRPLWVAFMFLLIVLTLSTIMPDGIHGCIESERQALLGVKSHLQYHYDELVSWNGSDHRCCHWVGVICSNKTAHVVGLDLSRMDLSGEISPHLLGLQHLNYLNLSWNNFDGKSIPKFLGSLTRLKYLDLFSSRFIGSVPQELGNLSKLVHLDISSSIDMDIYLDNADWIAGLTSLQYLDMIYVNLSKASNLVQALNALPSIREVTLRGCSITAIPHSLPHVNFTTLSYLDLGWNEIMNSTLPQWLFLPSLVYLDLSANFFGATNRIALARNACSLRVLKLSFVRMSINIGELEDVFSGCLRRSLEVLDLSVTGLTSNLPSWLSKMKNLNSLDLSYNSLDGPIPTTWLRKLLSMQYLDLSDNSLSGVLTEEHFSNLTRLTTLNISNNPSLLFDVDPNWKPPFQLEALVMSSVQIVGRRFPTWLCTQEKLNVLEISNASISDSIPDCFSRSSAQLSSLDLSHNNISGELQYVTSNVILSLDLSHNSLSGTIPHNFGHRHPLLQELSLAGNNINGNIPTSTCNMTMLVSLDLSNNSLSGSIPDCWDNLNSMVFISLSHNSLSGTTPNLTCSKRTSIELKTLIDLSHNNLFGSIPQSMQNCTDLQILDVSHNNLNGTIPTWLGDKLLSLVVLRLNFNMFNGQIPSQLSNLSVLRILDLSHNYLTGSIPKHFGEFKAMQNLSYDSYMNQELPMAVYDFYTETYLGIEGTELPYSDNLRYVVLIDLSCNHLSGSIPEELGTLKSLISLNLSMNNLSGGLIDNIGNLGNLISLDLSWNNLSGVLPSSLSSLNFLNHFNLSHNNFSGRIPSGNQLQSLDDPSIYIGNNDLCGFPLKACSENKAISNVPSIDEVENEEALWFYIGYGSGFAVGFNITLFSLLLNKSWRIVYFKFVDSLYDKIYVFFVLKVVRNLY